MVQEYGQAYRCRQYSQLRGIQCLLYTDVYLLYFKVHFLYSTPDCYTEAKYNSTVKDDLKWNYNEYDYIPLRTSVGFGADTVNLSDSDDQTHPSASVFWTGFYALRSNYKVLLLYIPVIALSLN